MKIVKIQNVIEETFKRKKYIFKKVILINFVKGEDNCLPV